MKWRNEAPWMAGVGLAVLALYLWTMPRTVMLEDDGLFLMAATHWGVAHPPGYPLFTLLAHGFTQLPLGTVAFRGHLASAVLGAGACVALYLMVRGLVPHRLSALLAALAFGTSEHFWSQAIIAEVYTLNALTALGGYALVLEASRAQETQVWKCLLAAAVVFGLGLANHWPLMVLAFPGMLVAVLPVWRIVLRTLPWLAATTLLAAGFPYGLMAWRSQANPETSFYGPIESWAEFWFYVSRQGYTSADFSPSAGWSDKLRFMADFAGEVWGQYTPVGALLALLGLLWLLRNQRWTVALSGLLIFLGNSIALFAIIGFDHDFLNEAVVRPYPLVSYGVQALWMGLGAGWFFRQAQVRWPEHSRKLVVGGAVLGVGLLGFIVPMNWNANDRSEDRFADTHGRMLLESLAPDAVLFVYGDAETGPLGYLNCVEGVRADVTLISLQGLVYHDRLFPPRAPKRVKQEELLWFIGSTSRPVYYTVEEELLPHGRGVRHFGFVKRIERQGIPAELQMTLNARGVNYFKELHAMPTSPDRWVQFRRNKLLYLYGGFLGYAVLSRNDVLLERTRLLVQLAEQNYYSLTGMIEVLMKHGSTPHWSQVQEWLNRSEQLKDETLDKERNGRHHYLRGFLAYQLGDWERAKQEFRKSVEWYNHPENSAKAALEKLEEGG